MSSENRARFLELMKNEILKLDQAELDFGIYRILNHRRDAIEEFFDERLPALIDGAITDEGATRRTELGGRLERLRSDLDAAAQGMGLASAFDGDEPVSQLTNVPKAKEYAAVRVELEALDAGDVFAEPEEDRLYHHLLTFFSRYYRDGDFQPQQRRARDARYSVPYNGEDVHFHWRSRGSHYIKTTEELKSYAYKADMWRVRFELVEAYQEPDNVKGSTRYFIPVPGDCRLETEDGSLFVVPFAFRRLTADEEKRYGKASDELDGDSAQERLLNDLIGEIERPDGVGKEELLRHMLRYAKKNRTDYFVHPQLGDFLRGELDYYLKNEFLDVEGLTSSDVLSDRLLKMHVLRAVALEVVGLLDEVESIQAAAFEKRKLVLASTYLVSLQALPEEFWDEVLANDAQVQAWRDEFGLSGRVGRKTLEERPTLVVDTSLFDPAFQSRVLASVEDLDEMLDGLLVKGENYSALRTLAPSFSGRIVLIYIDPPYNTGKDGFLYRDDFARHSAWLSMFGERFEMGFSLLHRTGALVTSIGDHEVSNLLSVGDAIAGDKRRLATLIWNTEGNIDNQSRIKGNHEYLVLYVKSDDGFEAPQIIDPNTPADSKLLNTTIENSITKNGPANPPSTVDLPIGFPTSFAEGVVEPDAAEWPKLSNRVEVSDYRTMGAVSASSGWSSRALLDLFLKNGCQPIPDRSGTPTWFKLTHTGAIYSYKERPDTQSHVVSVIRNVGTTKQMSGILAQMGLYFDYPKPVGLIKYVTRWHNASDGWHLDYFAGSGTSARAVIEVNRETGSKRRFLAVEVADYFDSILLPHVRRLMYAPGWEKLQPKPEPRFRHDGRPEWVERSPKLVQVLRLESFEDALANLVVRDGEGVTGDEFGYALPALPETQGLSLSTARLSEPFEYQLEVVTEHGTSLVGVDIVSTFNLLAGIRMRRFRETKDHDRRYVIVEGTQAESPVLVVWRSVNGLDPEAELEFLAAALPDLFGKTLSDYKTVYHNADSAISNSTSLDAEFKRLMFEQEPALQ